MFNGLFKTKYNRITFEDLQYAITKPNDFIIINTLPVSDQGCLIKNTTSYQTEEETINGFLNQYDFTSHTFIVYGRNSNDSTIETKYSQLSNLGFTSVFIYNGGMFEWLLLQDIYGDTEFPTTKKELDILKYKPTRTLKA